MASHRWCAEPEFSRNFEMSAPASHPGKWSARPNAIPETSNTTRLELSALAVKATRGENPAFSTVASKNRMKLSNAPVPAHWAIAHR
jgi:hypothetical protein